jgi:hypothetical protein
MMNEPVLVCPNVKGPQAAYEVLRRMPWDRLSHGGISSNVKWNASLGPNSGNPDVDVVYAGTLRKLEGEFEFGLPPAEYRVKRHFLGEAFSELIPAGGFPLELVYTHDVPRTFGLDIYLPHDNPAAAKVLTQEIIRDLTVAGFVQNSYPLVDAMVFAGRDLVRRIEKGEAFEPLLSIDKNGLCIGRKDVNGVRVFTDKELDGLRELDKPRELGSSLA